MWTSTLPPVARFSFRFAARKTIRADRPRRDETHTHTHAREGAILIRNAHCGSFQLPFLRVPRRTP